MNNLKFKALVVHLILSGRTEEALRLLSKRYKISIPKIRVGMPKGHVKNAACYVRKTETIHFSRREALGDPIIVLHEFYHHLRSVTDWHGGIDKNADKFAESFMKAYKKFCHFSYHDI